jgi:isopentenyl-diphosphate delta-isomerase
MSKKMEGSFGNEDPNASERKKDHISLAFQSIVDGNELDHRFYYEPVLSGHPDSGSKISKNFLGKQFDMPVWVSSMTGGTAMAGTINKNLARACADFGMGMGLGSCRQLLYDDTYLQDFQLRKIIGGQPLYANLGIAQIITLIKEEKIRLITELLQKLEADGLIVHINPLQEWLQPEGDRYFMSPLDAIQRLLEKMPSSKIIVKEVGQGMGIKSLESLLTLPLAAVDFAASGGTNFALLELLRQEAGHEHELKPLACVGHSAFEMVEMVNSIKDELTDKILCEEVIISGGIRDFLDGYYLINKCKISAVYGQASGFLKYAMGSYEELYDYVSKQKQGLLIANTFLRIK